MKLPTNEEIEARIKKLTITTRKYPQFKGHIKLGQRAYREGAKWMRHQMEKANNNYIDETNLFSEHKKR